jgi:hypothetical protein
VWGDVYDLIAVSESVCGAAYDVCQGVVLRESVDHRPPDSRRHASVDGEI